MRDKLNIGLIQPVIDPNICWNEDPAFVKTEKEKGKSIPYKLNIDKIAAERVWEEIKEGLNLLLSRKDKPDIILIPELHLPISKIKKIEKISVKYNVVILAGVDFQRNPLDKTKISNKGIIAIPNNWGSTSLISTKCSTLEFGKSYFTHIARQMFKNIEGEECFEDAEKNMYIFKSSVFGNFGVMICSDIFDIERMLLYQTEIQHLFIISLNKDLESYFALSETLTRMLYCNVVICNTGFYGGSLAVSPYHKSHERTIYRYRGQRMFNSMLVSVPINKLIEAQKFDFVNDDKIKFNIKFKSSPPGYADRLKSLSNYKNKNE